MFRGLVSKQIVKLCHKKTIGASEIADKLGVPIVYIEEELDILAKGTNNEYGLLRRLDNGKYSINFILLDTEQIGQAHELYMKYLPDICDIIVKFIEEHEKEYLAFPYLNKKVDLSLILWQQIAYVERTFSGAVDRILSEKYFSDISKTERPFSVYGYFDNGKHYGAGWDGIHAENICGYSRIYADNIYISRIKKHFSCDHDISNDKQLQLAIRAINGLEVDSLSDIEREQAAKAIECGYLYREGDTLYTKLLVSSLNDDVFAISNKLYDGYYEKAAEEIAKQLAVLIRRFVPDHLIGEWRLANDLAALPVRDALTEVLIERGIITPPKDGIGAEGCWLRIEK